MYKNYPHMLAILIMVGVIVGLVVEIKQEQEIEVERDFNISTPTGNHSFQNDREFIEFLEGF